MPVFEVGNKIEFIFPNGGSINFPNDVLTPFRRKIGEFEFNTPPDKYIKELFYNHRDLLIRNKHKGSHLENYKIDKEFLDSLTIPKA